VGALSRLVPVAQQKHQCRKWQNLCGGLTKFEPKEIERLRIPALEALIEVISSLRGGHFRAGKPILRRPLRCPS